MQNRDDIYALKQEIHRMTVQRLLANVRHEDTTHLVARINELTDELDQLLVMDKLESGLEIDS